VVVGHVFIGNIMTASAAQTIGGSDPVFAAMPVYRAPMPVYALAWGDFDPTHPGGEVACLLRDASVVQLSPDAAGWTATLRHHGLTVIQGMIDRPTICIGDVHSGFAGNEIVIDGGKHLTVIFRKPDGAWSYQIVFDSTGYVGAGWGSRVGDIDPNHAGDEIFHMYEGILDFGTGRLWREVGGAWREEVVYNAQVVMDSAIGEFDPVHAGNELVAATEMGPTYELYPPPAGQTGNWPIRTLWDNIENAAWVVKIADVDPDRPGNELVYGTRYNDRITMSYATGSFGHQLQVLFTGVAPPGYQTMYDVAVGDVWPDTSGLEILGVDASGSVYMVSRQTSAWSGRTIWQNALDPLYAVITGDFLPAYAGDELLVAGESGVVTLLMQACPADLDRDMDVDLADFALFQACFNGPNRLPAGGCTRDADLDGDADVDLADFGVFQNCFNGPNRPPACEAGPRIVRSSHSDCLFAFEFAGEGDPYPGCGKDIVEVTVEAGTLRVVHRNATYNCCPDDIRVSLSTQGNRLTLTEEEILTMPCHCLCCYDVQTEVAGLTPGPWLVEYCWYDYETGGPVCSTQEVYIP